jgi:hypothetical protein
MNKTIEIIILSITQNMKYTSLADLDQNSSADYTINNELDY